MIEPLIPLRINSIDIVIRINPIILCIILNPDLPKFLESIFDILNIKNVINKTSDKDISKVILSI